MKINIEPEKVINANIIFSSRENPLTQMSRNPIPRRIVIGEGVSVLNSLKKSILLPNINGSKNKERGHKPNKRKKGTCTIDVK